MPTNPDTRLKVARKYLGSEHRYAETMLARIDAEDPLRGPLPDEAMEALLDEWFNGNDWRRGMTATALVDRMEFARRALTAALTVMAGTEAPDPGEGYFSATKALDVMLGRVKVPDDGDIERDHVARLEYRYEALARAECRRQDIDPDDIIADGGHLAWHLVGHQAVEKETAFGKKTEFTSTTIDGAPTKVRYTPPDPKSQWTAEQRNALITTMQVVQKLARHVGRTVLADEIDYEFSAAFKPEPVWPPESCTSRKSCGVAGFCRGNSDFCPHAGERADG